MAEDAEDLEAARALIMARRRALAKPASNPASRVSNEPRDASSLGVQGHFALSFNAAPSALGASGSAERMASCASPNLRFAQRSIASGIWMAGAVLGLLACGPTQAGTQSPAPAVSVGAQPDAVAKPGASSADSAEMPERRPPPTDTLRAPPIVEPSGQSELVAGFYHRFNQSMSRVQELFRQLDSAMPAPCADIAASACINSLRQYAKLERELTGVTRFIGPVCDGSSEQAKAFEEYARNHLRYVDSKRKALEALLGERISPHGEPGQEALDDARALAAAEQPLPCLSFGCPKNW